MRIYRFDLYAGSGDDMRGIDLFSGGGCGSAGARHAGLTMVAAADSWDIAAKTYQANFKEAKVVNARLTDRSGPEVFGDLGKIDMLIASPECTHHSIARGNRPVDEESRRSGWYVMNFIKKLEPYGLIEYSKSGRVAIVKWSRRFHEHLKELQGAASL